MTPLRPHVLYVLSAYPVLSQTFVRNEIQALRDRGARVSVLSLNGGDEGTVDPSWAGEHAVMDGPASWPATLTYLLWWLITHPHRLLKLLVEVTRLRGSGGTIALRTLPRALKQLAQDGSVVAVHTHFGWRATAPCLYAGRLLGAPTSVTLHANDIYVPAPDLGAKLARFDRLVTVCSYNVGVIQALAPALPAITIVPCGVDVPEGTPEPVTGARLLSVGRIVTKKGFADLVAAMEVVTAERPDATLDIVGDGPDRPQLTALINASPARRHITLRGSEPNDEVLRRMGRCSAFVLACKREPDGGSDALPVVIREAMARARPVVSTDIGGIPETLDGVGWVIPSGDVPALAAAILAAIATGPEAERRGRAARQRTVDRFTLDHTARGMWAVLELGERGST